MSEQTTTSFGTSSERVNALRGLKTGAHIHVLGICGTGMTAVASLLRELGYHVTGSDKAFYPPMGEVVRKIAHKIFESYDPANVDVRPDFVVIGNSIRRDNPELARVLSEQLPFASMPEVFQALLIGTREQCRHSVVVAGTHGKTTTTALIAKMFDHVGWKPGYFVGGVPRDLPGGLRRVDASVPLEHRVVVLEGDEYDSAFFLKQPKFLSYRPDIAVMTSLEFDHADIYNNVEEIEAEFTKLAELVPKDGSILICDTSERLLKLEQKWKSEGTVQAQIYCYGESPGASFRLTKREASSNGQKLSLELQGEKVDVTSSLSGPHNALNLLVGSAVGHLLGLKDKEISNGLQSFTGVLRRQQILFNKNNITVLEDFAHHPTAVDVTLKGLGETYPGRRLIAVFEPRSNTSRRAFFQKEYAKSFSSADAVVIQEILDAAGTYSRTQTEIHALNVPQIVQELSTQGKTAFSFKTIEEIEQTLAKLVTTGDVVVFMSNGDFGGLMKRFVESVSRK